MNPLKAVDPLNPLEEGLGLPKPGDVVLGYGPSGLCDWKFWGKGVWFTVSGETVTSKGGGCGFADKAGCVIAITRNGVKERWLRVGTFSGRQGWVLAEKLQRHKGWVNGNFVRLFGCD